MVARVGCSFNQALVEGQQTAACYCRKLDISFSVNETEFTISAEIGLTCPDLHVTASAKPVFKRRQITDSIWLRSSFGPDGV